jgi:urea carboxylase
MAGGLATTTTIVRADFWRLGQCRPGDTIRFNRISWKSALTLRQRTEAYIRSIADLTQGRIEGKDLAPIDLALPDDWDETILYCSPGNVSEGTVEIKYRQVSA